MTTPFALTPPVADAIPRFGPLCCEQCFEHDWLLEYVRSHSLESGSCDFCGSRDVALIEVSALSLYFENLMAIYSPVGPDNFNPNIEDPIDVGEPLDWLIDEDWSVFSETLSWTDRRMNLLEAILDARYTDSEWRNDKGDLDSFDSLELYTSRQSAVDYKLIDAWDEHKQEVIIRRGRARPFGIGNATLNRIANTLRAGVSLYRARPGFNTVRPDKFSIVEEPYCDSEIGAPPASKASAGRANREYQVVLYCADQDATAVAEVRPAQGFVVSLGRFKTIRDLKLLDLVMPRPLINPFTDRDLQMAVETRALFGAFARDLKTPLRRSDDVTTYLPSQNLTDAVRRAGFDGIWYPSAMNPGGSNVVLFDPADAEFVDSQLVEITSVNVQFEPCERAN